MFYDLAGRDFNKKPMGKGTLIEVHKGFFDTLDDNELYKDRLGIIVNVERFMEDDNRGNAKRRFFGEEDWSKCPCYPPEDNTHGCGSAACCQEITKNGICHCNLFMKD